MEEAQLTRLEAKLDVLVKLLAGNLAVGKSKRDAIIMLRRCGLDNKTIADAIDTTPAAVSQVMYELKKAGKAAPEKPEGAQHDE